MKKARFLTAALVAVQVTALTMMSAASVSAADGAQTGAAATPDNPYYAWAAEEKPQVDGSINLLDKDLTNSNPSVCTFNDDGSLSVKNAGYGSAALSGYDTINLEETPYLYWSFEQAEGSYFTFILKSENPYGTYRYKGETESGKMFTKEDISGAKSNFIVGSETGCINMYDWYKSFVVDTDTIGMEKLKAMPLNKLEFTFSSDAGKAVDVNLQYMFFGPDPAKATTTETTTTTTEEPTTTTEATTEATTAPTQAPVDEVKSIVSMDPADWSTPKADEMVIANGADGSLELSNTNGNWPAAGYILPDGGITFDPAKTNLNYDFTVGPDTNIILFFNGSTPEDYKDDQVKSISHQIDGAELNGDDIMGNGATFKGSFAMSAVEFPAGCYNEDGTLTLTGVKVFAAGQAGSKVVIRDLSIETQGEGTTTVPDETTTTVADETTTTVSGTDTTSSETATTADGTDVTTGSAATTTSAQKDNPKTGDNGAMMVGGAALLVLSSGALLLTLKKAKSR